jgi:hypothetical protein
VKRDRRRSTTPVGGCPSQDDFEARAVDVRVTKDELIVELIDHRRLSVPLWWFPRLLNASSAARRRWRLLGDGEGINWPGPDEDISVAGLLKGIPSMESRESLARAGVPLPPRQGSNALGVSFDCVLMKREIQAKIAAETAGMSWEEEKAYYNRRAQTGPLGEFGCNVEPKAALGPFSSASPAEPKRRRRASSRRRSR